MPLTAGGNAPYAPPGTVIDVLTRYRDRGMTTPFNIEVLERAGVSESLSRRTMATLKHLELIDAEGNPTAEFEAANRAPKEQYQEQMQEIITGVYADVLGFADPASDSYDRVRDAFRGFNPRGQQDRMVTLFLGLLDFLSLDTSAASGSRSENAATNGQRTSPKKAPAKKTTTTKKSERKVESDSTPDPKVGALPPGLVGLLQQIPRDGAGWPASRRDEFLAAFAAVLNFTIPVRDAEPAPSGAGDEEDSS